MTKIEEVEVVETMKPDEIKRLDLKSIDLGQKRTKITVEASNLLGYRSTERGRLLAVLEKLEIAVLDVNDVTKYKRSKTRAPKAQARGRQMWGDDDDDRRRTKTVKTWKLVDLASYTGVVPDHVLMKAVAIKKELPSVTFEVETLTTTKRRIPVRLPDPFLVATLPGLNPERVYIDVWDEPDFESKLYS